MNRSGENIEQLLLGYFSRSLTEEEYLQVEQWLAESPANQKRYDDFMFSMLHIRWAQEDGQIDVSGAQQRFREKKRSHRRFRWLGAAAAGLLFLFSSAVFYYFQTREPVAPVVATGHVVLPVRPQAILILSNGNNIQLSDYDASFTEQNGLNIEVDRKRGIIYPADAAQNAADELIYNTLVVPRGGEYYIVLSDGTEVWLNAESELHYPVYFSGRSRNVILKGEAYFQVKEDVNRPFIVNVEDFSLQVYGTEFNLNGYEPENIELALVEGSVGFKANPKMPEKMLRPGQLGVANRYTGESEISEVDTDIYTAWKSKDMVFRNESLESIMKKISRWYDVDVTYGSESIKQMKFHANLRKYADIEEFLYFMEKISDLHFTLEGTTIRIDVE